MAEKMEKAERSSKQRQRKREVTCAVNLAKLLDNYLNDSSEEFVAFKTTIKAEAKDLTETAFGGTLIGVLAYIYNEQACSYLGFKSSVGDGMGLGNISSSAHTIGNKFRLVSSAVKTYTAARKEGAKRQQSGAGAEASLSPESFDSMLETLWNYTVVDVESTLREVCFKLLKDSSVPIETRVKRAQGLLLISQIFMESAQTSDKGLLEIGSKFKQQLPQ
jgi:X-domain of DnaJ-containing